jgi:hypothetical protein
LVSEAKKLHWLLTKIEQQLKGLRSNVELRVKKSYGERQSSGDDELWHSVRERIYEECVRKGNVLDNSLDVLNLG